MESSRPVATATWIMTDYKIILDYGIHIAKIIAKSNTILQYIAKSNTIIQYIAKSNTIINYNN